MAASQQAAQVAAFHQRNAAWAESMNARSYGRPHSGPRAGFPSPALPTTAHGFAQRPDWTRYFSPIEPLGHSQPASPAQSASQGSRSSTYQSTSPEAMESAAWHEPLAAGATGQEQAWQETPPVSQQAAGSGHFSSTPSAGKTMEAEEAVEQVTDSAPHTGQDYHSPEDLHSSSKEVFPSSAESRGSAEGRETASAIQEGSQPDAVPEAKPPVTGSGGDNIPILPTTTAGRRPSPFGSPASQDKPGDQSEAIQGLKAAIQHNLGTLQNSDVATREVHTDQDPEGRTPGSLDRKIVSFGSLAEALPEQEAVIQMTSAAETGPEEHKGRHSAMEAASLSAPSNGDDFRPWYPDYEEVVQQPAGPTVGEAGVRRSNGEGNIAVESRPNSQHVHIHEPHTSSSGLEYQDENSRPCGTRSTEPELVEAPEASNSHSPGLEEEPTQSHRDLRLGPLHGASQYSVGGYGDAGIPLHSESHREPHPAAGRSEGEQDATKEKGRGHMQEESQRASPPMDEDAYRQASLLVSSAPSSPRAAAMGTLDTRLAMSQKDHMTDRLALNAPTALLAPDTPNQSQDLQAELTPESLAEKAREEASDTAFEEALDYNDRLGPSQGSGAFRAILEADPAAASAALRAKQGQDNDDGLPGPANEIEDSEGSILLEGAHGRPAEFASQAIEKEPEGIAKDRGSLKFPREQQGMLFFAFWTS